MIIENLEVPVDERVPKFFNNLGWEYPQKDVDLDLFYSELTTGYEHLKRIDLDQIVRRCEDNLSVREPKSLPITDKLDRFTQKVKDGLKTRLTTDDKEVYKIVKDYKNLPRPPKHQLGNLYDNEHKHKIVRNVQYAGAIFICKNDRVISYGHATYFDISNSFLA